jgi:hypothetical protein
MSGTGGGASFTQAGAGAQYATPNAFKSKKKVMNPILELL